MRFADLGLSDTALLAVADLGYENPTPVQEKAIPLALQGRDVIAAAKTGTGKTAAFALPCMDTLPHRAEGEKGPFLLIITPTRELASQIADTCMPIGKRTRHFVGVFLGGVAYGPQINRLERGIDVCIATPGRLIDLMERGAVDLSNVTTLVIDEADRMLDMGFWPQVDQIVSATPKDRQTLLFSATIDRSQDQVMFGLLNNPEIVQIAQRGETADKIEQFIIRTDRAEKPKLLNCVVKQRNASRAIIFTKTKGGADNCTRRLRAIGVPTDAIHADRSQAQRSKALEDFRAGRLKVLVATDVLARGIDVPQVDYVLNYDLPIMPEDYVHRIGRTGRAGQAGVAISLVTPDTRNLLRSVEKFIGQKLPEIPFTVTDDAFDPIEGADINVLADGKKEMDRRRAAKELQRQGATAKKPAKVRDRDLERAAEHKRRREAEAAGIEYVPEPKAPKPARDPKKLTLAERQAAAEAAFNAMFEQQVPTLPGQDSSFRQDSASAEGKGAERAAAGKAAGKAAGNADRGTKAAGKGKKNSGYNFEKFDKRAKSKKDLHDGEWLDEKPRSRKGKNKSDEEFRYDRMPKKKNDSRQGKKASKASRTQESFERGYEKGFERGFEKGWKTEGLDAKYNKPQNSFFNDGFNSHNMPEDARRKDRGAKPGRGSKYDGSKSEGGKYNGGSRRNDGSKSERFDKPSRERSDGRKPKSPNHPYRDGGQYEGGKGKAGVKGKGKADLKRGGKTGGKSDFKGSGKSAGKKGGRPNRGGKR